VVQLDIGQVGEEVEATLNSHSHLTLLWEEAGKLVTVEVYHNGTGQTAVDGTNTQGPELGDVVRILVESQEPTGTQVDTHFRGDIVGEEEPDRQGR